MKKNYFKNLMQVSLLLGAAFVITSCDDIVGQEDNPVASYVQWQATTPEEVTLKIGNTYTVKATAVSSAIIVYESENPKIAKVDPVTGEITAVAVGETTINAVISGASSAGKSVFVPEKISIKVIVKDKYVTVALKEGVTDQTIVTLDPNELDLTEFFDVYPEATKTFNNKLEYYVRQVTAVDPKTKEETIATTDFAYTTVKDGVLTINDGYNEDATVYVYASITTAPDGYEIKQNDKKEDINNVAKFKLTIKKSIAYMNAKGERTVLASDQYKEKDLSTVDALEAGTYYVTNGVDDNSKTIDINGNVTLIFQNGVNANLQNIDDKADGSILNIFGEAIPGAKAGTYEAWNPNIVINNYNYVTNCITNFKEINIYAGTLTTYGGIIVKDVNVYAGALYANSNWNSKYAMKLSGKLTVNGGLVLARGEGSDETSFAVIGDVVLNKGLFHAYNSDYRAVKGSLTAATGFQFLQGDTNVKKDATKVTGTSSNSKYIWGEAIPED